jgi:hypothetical protein
MIYDVGLLICGGASLLQGQSTHDLFRCGGYYVTSGRTLHLMNCICLLLTYCYHPILDCIAR